MYLHANIGGLCWIFTGPSHDFQLVTKSPPKKLPHCHKSLSKSCVASICNPEQCFRYLDIQRDASMKYNGYKPNDQEFGYSLPTQEYMSLGNCVPAKTSQMEVFLNYEIFSCIFHWTCVIYQTYRTLWWEQATRHMSQDYNVV